MILFLEDYEDTNVQQIDLPTQNLVYTIVDTSLVETVKSKNNPIITRDQTNYNKRNENGFNCEDEKSFIHNLEYIIVRGLENAYKKSNNKELEYYKDDEIEQYTYINMESKNKSQYKSFIKKSKSNDLYDNTFNFAFYIFLKIKYDKNKYRLNSDFEQYLTKFNVRFADHVTIKFQGKKYLLNKRDLRLGNIMILDNSNNALAFKNVTESLNTIFEYRLKVLDILEYLANKYGSNLTFITEENVDKETDEQFTKLLELFAKNKMQPTQLKLTDYLDYEKYKDDDDIKK